MLLNNNYADLNIRELAKSCNLGLGTVYNYFSSKEELAGQIFKNDWDKTLQLVEELKDSDCPFKEKLRQVYSSLETFISQYMNIFREMVSDTAKKCPHSRYVEIYQKMKELIDNDKENGKVTSQMDSGKLSYFIISNLCNVIRYKHMTFDELYECVRI